MAIVKIDNIDDARKIGPKYGITFPEKQGRPPLTKLARAIVEAGDTIESTSYFAAELATKRVVVIRNPKDVAFKVTTSVPRADGKGRRPATGTFTLEEIRNAADAHGRGRVSNNAIIAAAAKLKDWGSPDDLGKVTIQRMESGAKTGEPVVVNPPAQTDAKDVEPAAA